HDGGHPGPAAGPSAAEAVRGPGQRPDARPRDRLVTQRAHLITSGDSVRSPTDESGECDGGESGGRSSLTLCQGQILDIAATAPGQGDRAPAACDPPDGCEPTSRTCFGTTASATVLRRSRSGQSGGNPAGFGRRTNVPIRNPSRRVLPNAGRFRPPRWSPSTSPIAPWGRSSPA